MRTVTRVVSGPLLFLILTALAGARPLGESPDGPEAVKVYLTEEAALEKAFPAADTVWSETWVPSAKERRRIERRLGWRLAEESFEVHRGMKKGESTGYAVVGEQIGLYRPITFMVKVTPEGRVESVRVMVYRESRGGEVRRGRFLSQYKGKSTKDPIRINRDIIGVTGATLSVRAINAGVKKSLAIIDIGYLQKGGD